MAIVKTRKVMSQKTLDLRTRLIACFLFICFEIRSSRSCDGRDGGRSRFGQKDGKIGDISEIQSPASEDG
jgi:hypothetical protein